MSSSKPANRKAVVIVQARMSSTRLPGKVLMDLEGQTVLSHVLTRCKAIEEIDSVICATVEGPEGDAIAEEALTNGCDVFKGSEQDVLDRFYRAAKSVGADIILRVTSDSPLLDPKIYSAALKLLIKKDADYVTNNMPPSWPHGLDCEVFTFKWLKRAAQKAQKPSEREHVTPWIRNHSKTHCRNLEGPSPSLNTYRWTLDTEEDFTMMKALFAALPKGKSSWDWEIAKRTVDANKGLSQINADYDPLLGLRKSEAEDEDWARSWLASEPESKAYTSLGTKIDYSDKSGRRIISLRARDLLSIMTWRNDQINILRQSRPLTPLDQKTYYEDQIRPTFNERKPSQILTSYLKNDELIGYGGLTNIDWDKNQAEVSFLVSTERSADRKLHCKDFKHFLKLLEQLAFKGLKLEKLVTETYDIRPHHIEVLENNGYESTGCLKGHVIIEGKPRDSLLHARTRESAASP